MKPGRHMHHIAAVALVIALAAPPSPASPPAPRQTTAGEWEADFAMRVGDHAYLEGDLYEALESFRSAAAKDPLRADARWRMAHCMVALRRLREATVELERALALAPEDPRILNTLAVVQMRKGDLQDAIRTAERAVARAPGVSDVWDTLGWAALTAGQRSRARAAFETALRLDPRNKSSRRGLRQLAR